ncbi:MAG: DMT family transporter [Candidatus Altiarchaeota archaeon]
MDSRVMGVLSLVLASFFMGMNGVFLVPLNSRLPMWEIVGLRFVLTFVCVAILAAALGKGSKTKDLKGEVAMGLIGGVLILSYFLSIVSLGLSVAALLLYTAPLFGTVFSHFILGERIRRAHVICLMTAFIGLLMVLKPSLFLDPRLLVGVVAPVCYGFKMVYNRRLGRVDSTWVITYYYMLVPSVLFLAYLAMNSWAFVVPVMGDLPYLGGLVLLCSVIGLLLQHYGASVLDVSVSSVVLMSEAVFSVLFGIMVFGERLDAGTLVGGLLVIASGAYLGFTRNVDN